jgi:hypothetical protein
MPAGVITRSAHPEALWPGVKSWFGLSYEEEPATWSKIFERESSDKYQEIVVEATGFGLAPVKTEGAPIEYDSDQQGYKSTFTHVVYALGYIVTMEELADGQYRIISTRRAGNLARSMRWTAEVVHANVLNRGFDVGHAIGDGAALFSASHPTLSGNQSNLLTAADLSETALEDAAKATWRLKSNRGTPINSGIRRLIISPEDAFNATRILNSVLRPGTPNNDINALNAMGIVPDVVVNKYLTDTDAWFVQTDVRDGLMSMWRNEPTLDQDNDFDTKNARASSYMRFAAGCGDWRSVMGNAGA